MATIKMMANQGIKQSVEIIRRDIGELGLSMTLVDEVRHQTDDEEVYLFVFEKYYYRAQNRASLSILLFGNDMTTHVHGITSGGSQGLFFRFSWGAEKNFINKFRNLLLKYNFREIN